MAETVPTEAQALTAEELDPSSALKRVLRASLYADTLCRGLHETARAIESKKAKLVVLAEDCDEKLYKQLVQLLCKENDIPILLWPGKKELGEWVGLCKYDSNLNARKVRGCSSVAITDFPTNEEAALKIIRDKASH
jgi:small subunit ribosomal protein S12e